MSRIRVTLGDRILDDWLEIGTRYRIDAAAGAFMIRCKPHEVHITHERSQINVRGGMLAKIEVESSDGKWDESIAAGYVDRVQVELEEGRRTLVIYGRTLTSSIIDCSAKWQPGEYRDATLAEIIFGVSDGLGSGFDVIDEPTQRLPLFRVEAGETAWQAIERVCRIFGQLAYAKPDGILEVSKPGRYEATEIIREGRNLIAGRAVDSEAERFSDYQVVGQVSGSDIRFGPAAAQVHGSAVDPAIKRYRPMTIIAEDSVTAEGAQSRAEWEAAVRAARSQSLNVVLPGWTRKRDGFYRLNERVHVLAESLGVQGRMLVTDLSHSISQDEPERVTLGLAREDAFVTAPVMDPTKDPFNPVTEGGW